MTKKIYVQISGRLGNQLFSYAFARKIQLASGGEILANFYEVDKTRKMKSDLSFKDYLKDFKIEYTNLDQMLPLKNMIFKNGSLDQKIYYVLFGILRRVWPVENTTSLIISSINKIISKFLAKKGLYVTPFLTGRFDISIKENSFIYGKFEDANLFENIQEELKESIEPIEPIRRENISFLEKIKSSDSVCISIRRGDFLTTDYKNDFFQCDDKYFQKSISIIKEKVENPTFFVFSDDVEYAEQFTRDFLYFDKVFVEIKGNSIGEKLKLMKSCKHFIISNSTFSWWTQFLGDFDDKIVIGPNKWFPVTGKFTNDKLIQDFWIKL